LKYIITQSIYEQSRQASEQASEEPV